MKSFAIATITLSCLVAYASATCVALCSQGCNLADTLCKAAGPLNLQCQGLKNMCSKACTTACNCQSTCEAKCPPTSDANPESYTTNAKCQNDCVEGCSKQMNGKIRNDFLTWSASFLQGLGMQGPINIPPVNIPPINIPPVNIPGISQPSMSYPMSTNMGNMGFRPNMAPQFSNNAYRPNPMASFPATQYY